MRENVSAAKIPHAAAGGADHVTISLGAVSIIPEVGSDHSDFLLKAGRMVQSAKDQGRNCVNAMR